MNKPTLEQFGLTELEYTLEKKKEDKITSFVMFLLLVVIVIYNIYYLFFSNTPFSLINISGLLVIDIIGGSILLTWMILIFFIFSVLKSFLFPRWNIVKHSQKYIEYEKALASFEKEKNDQKLAKEFVDRIRTSNRNKINKQVIEAEKILNAYGGVIANGFGQGIALKKSFLPCSVARIKQSYFTYIDGLIKRDGKLTNDVNLMLTSTYERLNSFVDDSEAEEINEIFNNINNKIEKEETTNDLKTEKLRDYIKIAYDGTLYNEINEFIAECYKKYKRNS